MAANPSIANPSLVPDTERASEESGKPKLKSLLERSEDVLCKAFGDDEQTIVNSLRGL